MLVLIASLYRTPIQGEICWNWILSKILSPNIGMLDCTLHMFSLAALQECYFTSLSLSFYDAPGPVYTIAENFSL